MTEKKEKIEQELPTCGIIMPISLIDNCPPHHWADILGILKDVCLVNGFQPNLVSDADDIGVIHKRIIENIYSSDIVICDVSCKNANVMFELGMRLAFDKPTIIIKDDLTGYSFDTSLIEHLEYPRDLRFTTINNFKESLGKKLKATYEKAKSDSNYSTFLQNFGKYKIAHLEDREITSEKFILDAITEIQKDMRVLKNISANERNDEISNTKKLNNRYGTSFNDDFAYKNFNDFVKSKIGLTSTEFETKYPKLKEQMEKDFQNAFRHSNINSIDSNQEHPSV